MKNEVIEEVVEATEKSNIIGTALGVIGGVGLTTLACLAIWRKQKKKKAEAEEIIDVEAEEMEE